MAPPAHETQLYSSKSPCQGPADGACRRRLPGKAPGRPLRPPLPPGRQGSTCPGRCPRVPAFRQPRTRTGLAPSRLGPAARTPPPPPGRAGKRFGFLSSPRSASPVANQRAAPLAHLPRRGPISERGAALPIQAELPVEGGEGENPSGRPRPLTGRRTAPAAASRPLPAHSPGRPAPRPPPPPPGARAASGPTGERREGGGGGRPEQSERSAAEKQDGGRSVRRRCGGPAPFPWAAPLRRRMTRG